MSKKLIGKFKIVNEGDRSIMSLTSNDDICFSISVPQSKFKIETDKDAMEAAKFISKATFIYSAFAKSIAEFFNRQFEIDMDPNMFIKTVIEYLCEVPVSFSEREEESKLH